MFVFAAHFDKQTDMHSVCLAVTCLHCQRFSRRSIRLRPLSRTTTRAPGQGQSRALPGSSLCSQGPFRSFGKFLYV